MADARCSSVRESIRVLPNCSRSSLDVRALALDDGFNTLDSGFGDLLLDDADRVAGEGCGAEEDEDDDDEDEEEPERTKGGAAAAWRVRKTGTGR